MFKIVIEFQNPFKLSRAMELSLAKSFHLEIF